MSENLLDHLHDSAYRVLESSTFVFVDDVDHEYIPYDDGEDFTGAALQYEGPVRGEIQLWVQNELPEIFASNMLGVDANDPTADQKREDALKEVLNMITGIFLTEHFGVEPVFQLGIPQIHSNEKFPDWHSLKYVWLDAEGQKLLITHRDL